MKNQFKYSQFLVNVMLVGITSLLVSCLSNKTKELLPPNNVNPILMFGKKRIKIF